jgi:phage terminase small subunit
MTPKQKAFADYYIQTGNATEAARRAGYSENNVGENAAKTLKTPKVTQYIAERMAQQDKSRVADANEVIEFYTAVMRGEVKDQFGLEASLSDRLKAGDSLMKRYAAAADRNRGAMEKLDGLLKEFQDAIKSEAD